jgi:hypothetical protein
VSPDSGTRRPPGDRPIARYSRGDVARILVVAPTRKESPACTPVSQSLPLLTFKGFKPSPVIDAPTVVNATSAYQGVAA